jgi:hypothetical protein
MTSANGHFHTYPSLMTALRFGEDDLTANRQGRLSESQKTRMGTRARMMMLLALIVGSLPLTFVIVSTLVLSSSGQFSDPDDSSALAVLIVILIIAGIAGFMPLLLALPILRRVRQTLAEGTVSWVDGYVDFEYMDRRRYRMAVQDETGNEARFAVKADATEAFDPERRYRIYYTPLLRQVVAAEPDP